MTTLILRPCAKISHRRHVSTLAADGTETPLGWVAYSEPVWLSHKGTRSKTRDDAVRKLAAECCLEGPYQIEELAKRTRRVLRCARGCWRGVTVRLEAAR